MPKIRWQCLTTAEPSLERKNVDPDTLFSDEALFKKESIFDDVTPSTLVQPDESKPAQPKEEASDELDPLALFGGVGQRTCRASR